MSVSLYERATTLQGVLIDCHYRLRIIDKFQKECEKLLPEIDKEIQSVADDERNYKRLKRYAAFSHEIGNEAMTRYSVHKIVEKLRRVYAFSTDFQHVIDSVQVSDNLKEKYLEQYKFAYDHIRLLASL